MKDMRAIRYHYPASAVMFVIGVVAFIGSVTYVGFAQTEEGSAVPDKDIPSQRDSFVRTGEFVQASPSSNSSSGTTASTGEVAGTTSNETASDTTNVIIQGGNFLQLIGQLKDKLGSTGSSGQVLTAQGGNKPPHWAAVIPPGTIQFYAGLEVPAGWLECDGRGLSGAAYPKLFAAIGTAWGDGNGGEGEFNIPDLRGRVPIGAGDGDGDGDTLTERRLADTGGEEKHTLTNTELPANDYLSGGGILTETIRHDADDSRTYYGDTSTGTTAVTGEGQGHNIVQPFTVVR